jgi:hypothetical protein
VGHRMGTSVDLARAVAAAFGLPEKAVLLVLRHIRTTGAITFKGHGKGAATMTALDAAGLIIAVAGSPYAANAAVTYEKFAGLTLLDPHSTTTLVEYLTLVIDDLAGMSWRKPSDMRESFATPTVLAEACLKLTWVDGALGDDRPRIAVVRRLNPGTAGQRAKTFASEPLPNRYYDEARLMAEFQGLRLTTTRSVSLRALEQVARALAPPTELEPPIRQNDRSIPGPA